MILTEANHRFVPAMVAYHAGHRFDERIGPHEQFAESFARAVPTEAQQTGPSVALLDLDRDALFILEPRADAPAAWVIVTVKRYSSDVATRMQLLGTRYQSKRSRAKHRHYQITTHSLLKNEQE